MEKPSFWGRELLGQKGKKKRKQKSIPKIDKKFLKPPHISVWLRLTLYLCTFGIGALSLAETANSRFGQGVDIGIYIVAACCLAFAVYYLTTDLIRVTHGVRNALIEKFAVMDRIFMITGTEPFCLLCFLFF